MDRFFNLNHYKMKWLLNKLKHITLSLAIISNLLYGCHKDNADSADDITIKLGDNYQGGIVFYIDETGKHGLIAASTDQSTTDTWWNQSWVTTGAVSLTDGEENTNLIIQFQGDNGVYAAKLCRDYNAGGHNDWFLPSKDQLNMLFTHKVLVGGLTNSIYWSSSEYEIDSVWVQDFEDGEQHLDSKSDGANVHTRAIRAF